VNAFRKRLQRAEALVYERYVRSLTTEELLALIKTLDRDLLVRGYSAALLDRVKTASDAELEMLAQGQWPAGWGSFRR